MVTKLCVGVRYLWCASGVEVLGDVLGEVLGDVLSEVHGDVPSERWKVEALTQGEFSKDGFIEEVWKDCSCVKTVSYGHWRTYIVQEGGKCPHKIFKVW